MKTLGASVKFPEYSCLFVSEKLRATFLAYRALGPIISTYNHLTQNAVRGLSPQKAGFLSEIYKQLFSSYFLPWSSDLTTSVENEEPEAKTLETTSVLKGWQAADPSPQPWAPGLCLEGSTTCPLKEHPQVSVWRTQAHRRRRAVFEPEILELPLKWSRKKHFNDS